MFFFKYGALSEGVRFDMELVFSSIQRNCYIITVSIDGAYEVCGEGAETMSICSDIIRFKATPQFCALCKARNRMKHALDRLYSD